LAAVRASRAGQSRDGLTGTAIFTRAILTIQIYPGKYKLPKIQSFSNG
jgi:hypothetical protein